MSEEERLAEELASLRIRRDDEPRAAVRRTGGRDGRRSGVPGWLVALLLVGALGVGGWFVYREGHGRVFAEEVELGSVSLMSPAVNDVTLVATGYVYARKKATVAPKTGGRVARIFVDEGDHVKENQLLAELESADAQAQLQQVRADIAAARAKIERARADVEDAQIKLDREQTLLQKGVGTPSAFDDASARSKAARAQLAAAAADERAVEARQQAAQVLYENTKVRAPFDGTIVRKLTEVGEVIAPASSTSVSLGIVTEVALDNLEVQADVSESQFGKVKVGTPAEILLDAFPERRFRGQVSEIRQTVDRAKAAVTVKVKFTDETSGVLPDMAAKVSFLSHALDDAALKAAPKLVVPADAIVRRDGRSFVFVIDGSDERVHEAAITPGPTIGGLVEISNGPPPGTRLVRHPEDSLRDGAQVKEKKR